MNNNQPLLKKLEKLFNDEQFNAIEEELFKWFMFAYTDKGNGIKQLDSLNFEFFKAR